ncbi:MAG: RNA polymerase sigma-70 factor (ECF subfamily) [Oleiphilaceae bacterium]
MPISTFQSYTFQHKLIHSQAKGRQELVRDLENFLITIERRAFRIAQLATRCEADALDIVQDAMFKLASNYQHRPVDEWKPLFFKILESRIMDWHRKQTLRKKLFFWKTDNQEFDTESPTNEQHQDYPTELANPENEIISEQLGKHLLKCIAALPVQQQQCFILRSWEGLSISETALAMKLNENSVKTHYARALKKLKDQVNFE